MTVPKLTKEEKLAQYTSRVSSEFESLAHTATTLNTTSDEMSRLVDLLDAKLKTLHLGVAAWHRVALNKKYADYLGYAKVGKKWGLAIKSVAIDEKGEEDHSIAEAWPFNEGPRQLRTLCVPAIPDLLQTLNQRAMETIDLVMKQVEALKLVVDFFSNP